MAPERRSLWVIQQEKSSWVKQLLGCLPTTLNGDVLLLVQRQLPLALAVQPVCVLVFGSSRHRRGHGRQREPKAFRDKHSKWTVGSNEKVALVTNDGWKSRFMNQASFRSRLLTSSTLRSAVRSRNPWVQHCTDWNDPNIWTQFSSVMNEPRLKDQQWDLRRGCSLQDTLPTHPVQGDISVHAAKQKVKLNSIFSVCHVPCRSSSRRTSSLNRSWTNCETSSGRSTPCWPSGAETPRARRRSGLGCSLWTGHHRPAENTGTMMLYTFRGHGEEGGVDDGRRYSVYLDETSVGNTFSLFISELSEFQNIKSFYKRPLNFKNTPTLWLKGMSLDLVLSFTSFSFIDLLVIGRGRQGSAPIRRVIAAFRIVLCTKSCSHSSEVSRCDRPSAFCFCSFSEWLQRLLIKDYIRSVVWMISDSVVWSVMFVSCFSF